MNIRINIITSSLVVMAMTGCEPSPDLSINDVRVRYLEQNHPQLKNLRDEIAFQINTSRDSARQLTRLRNGFTQQASRDMVDSKIQAIRQQQQQLMDQLNRIDAEAERGVALKEFNTIDGGGERRTEIQLIVQESAQRVEAAARLNGAVDVMYNGESTHMQKPVQKMTLESYVYLNELPPVDMTRLRKVFAEHPELFDPNNKQGQRFITMIRNLKQHEPRVFENLWWIDIPVKSCTY